LKNANIFRKDTNYFLKLTQKGSVFCHFSLIFFEIKKKFSLSTNLYINDGHHKDKTSTTTHPETHQPRLGREAEGMTA